MKSFVTALLLCTLCLTTAAYGDPKAGFMTSELTNFAGTMTITVWYPTSNKEKGPSEYDFDGAVAADATRDAPIEEGTFPLIITDPGGGGPDTRFTYFPNAELLAADGYIVVIHGRNTQALEAQGALLSDLIDHMLYYHPLRDSIDASKIGAKGLSFGGIGVGSLAGGDRSGNPPDNRVRGVIIDEGALVCNFTFCEPVTIPVLLRDGGLLGDISDMAPELAALENAFPRFLVTLDAVSHASFVTGFCALSEGARLASLTYQQDVLGGIVEQEPRNLSYFFESLSNGDDAGTGASFIWNFDFFTAGDGTFGSAGDSCQSEFGGPAPATPALNAPLLDERTMIETLHATDLGFWETVFGNGNSKKTKLEKAVEKLDTVRSFVKVSE
jgi:hypothetical protein